jgi:Phasin protein
LFDTLQELHREWLSFGQAQFSEGMEVGREFARCRSPRDHLEVQMRYTRSSANRILTEATKLAELSVRVASASLQRCRREWGCAGTWKQPSFASTHSFNVPSLGDELDYGFTPATSPAAVCNGANAGSAPVPRMGKP